MGDAYELVFFAMRARHHFFALAAIASAVALVFACGSDSGNSSFDDGTDASSNDAQSFPDSIGFGETSVPLCNPCNDFPATPVIDPGGGDGGASGPAVGPAPANSPTLFGAAGSTSGGPCVFEPEVGTLFPSNWLRPRFRYVVPTGQNLFEIRLHTTREANDLVVYTRSDRWTMPKDMWTNLAAHVQNEPITMTVRGAVYDDGSGALTSGPSTGTSGDVSIAPAQAAGSIVYWVTSTASLKGFQVGDEGVADIVTPTQVGQPAGCIGCHASAGDGKFILSSTVNDGNGSHAWLEMTSSDGLATQPDASIVSPSASTLLLRSTQEAPTTSSAHFKAGDRIVVSNYNDGASNQLIWTDLEATSTNQYSGTGSYAGFGWGVLARTGDLEVDGTTPRQGGQAAFSHDGNTIAYVSANAMGYGVAVNSNDGDIKTIPYNDRKGGTSTPLAGASSPDFSEFYPTFSPAGDKLIAFDRVPAGGPAVPNGDNYSNAASEVFVVPAGGAAAPTRLAANDPPACLGGTNVSPGVSNSWPKWSPDATSVAGKTYYWIVFSSIREFGYPQLYLSSVVVDDASGTIDASHAALHIWNQPEAEHNHTPAWDFFSVPPTGPR